MSETWFNNYLFSFAGSGGRICGYGRDFCRCWWSEWFVASSEWATISQATTKSKVNINLCTWHLKGEDKRVIGLCVCVLPCALMCMKVKCVQIRSPLPESHRYSTTAAVSIGERAKCVAPYAEPQCSAVLGSALSFSLSPVKLATFKDHKHFSYCTNYLKKRAAQGGNMRQKCACIINTMLGNDVTVHLLIWDNSAPASVGNSLRSAHEIFRAKQCS